MEFTNGLGDFTSLKQDVLGLPMTQYEALVKRLDHLQSLLDRFTEQETKKTEFIVETRFRLKTIETQLEAHTTNAKEQAEAQQDFQQQIQNALNELRTQADAISRRADQFPHDIKLQWKGVTTFVSGGIIVIGAIWSFFQGLWWIYHNIFPKTGN